MARALKYVPGKVFKEKNFSTHNKNKTTDLNARRNSSGGIVFFQVWG